MKDYAHFLRTIRRASYLLPFFIPLLFAVLEPTSEGQEELH
jgi:hypothetical protein